MFGMRRRELFALLGAAAMTLWPLGARAQQPRKLPTIGFVGPSTAAVDRSLVDPFVQRLGELGWVEGRSIVIDYRPTEGLVERAGEIAAEFVRLNVDVIVTGGDAQALAAKRATTVIPIVLGAAGDPVGNGLVQALARPGGNVTGSSVQLTDTAGKRLEILREIVPDLRRLAISGNFPNPTVAPELETVQAAARALGLDIISAEFRRARIFRRRSKRSPAARKRFTSVPTRSCIPTRFTSMRWLWRRDCRSCIAFARMWKREVWSRTARTGPTSTGAPPIWSTRFSMEPSPPISRSSNRRRSGSS